MELLDRATWPSDLEECLRRHKSVLWRKEERDQQEMKERELLDHMSPDQQIAWMAQQSSNSGDLGRYEKAIEDIMAVLIRHTLLGYHATRLSVREINELLCYGMKLSGGELLEARIRNAQADGMVNAKTALKLASGHSAEVRFRKGMIWFFFYSPEQADEKGIGPLMRFWGGEALYRHWKSDSDIGPLLMKIGSPCIIEADVPIANLSPSGTLGKHTARQYLLYEGYQITEPALHVDWSRHPIAASNIRQILKHPEPEFLRRTHCDKWNIQLS